MSTAVSIKALVGSSKATILMFFATILLDGALRRKRPRPHNFLFLFFERSPKQAVGRPHPTTGFGSTGKSSDSPCARGSSGLPNLLGTLILEAAHCETPSAMPDKTSATPTFGPHAGEGWRRV